MATLKYEVLKHNMRKDKTWNVVIRVTHKRVMKYIPTTVFVTRDELTSSFKIKNFQKKEKCAISLEHLRALAAIPDEERSNSSCNVARDVFLISFMMMGANSIPFQPDVQESCRYHRPEESGRGFCSANQEMD